jgi:hypothetical protein
MEWIPSNPGDLDVETNARKIVQLARDVHLKADFEPKDGKISVVCAKYKSARMASKVVDCLNERYGSAYSWMVDIGLLH